MQHWFWAKKKKITTGTPGPDFHPLLFHLVDVAAVVEVLWAAVLARHLKEEISRQLALPTPTAGRWLSFWAGLHDFGKATPAFQTIWPAAQEWLAKLGLTGAPPLTRCPHGILTACLLEEFFRDFFPGLAPTLGSSLARLLGGHHGIFPRAGDTEAVSSSQRGNASWRRCQRELFKRVVDILHATDLTVPPITDPHPSFCLLFAGLVSVADWIGSDVHYFPFTDPAVDPVQYYDTARSQADKALRSLGWLGWRTPDRPLSFLELFPALETYGLRPLQQAVVNIGKQLTAPGLVIVEAPMGEGKTEAAIFLADHWASTLGQQGCYVALPTMATSNQMFSRVKEFLGHRFTGQQVNLQLLHGHASLSAEFQILLEKGATLYSPHEIAPDSRDQGEVLSSEVIAAEWFTHRKRGLLAPYGVGTIDQVLLAVLKTKHYFVRLFGLSSKTIIIDEVHAYDAYMVQLLERLLEWLAALGCSVVLLSATLPEKRHQALLAAYARGLGQAAMPAMTALPAYPRLTWITSTGQGATSFAASPHFTRSVSLTWLPPNNGTTDEIWPVLGKKLQEVLAGGGCAAVLCNTVLRAQEVYAFLRRFFQETSPPGQAPELTLFHARYLYADREAREWHLRRCFGKPGGWVEGPDGTLTPVTRPQKAILVATQVIEQSLDIDFDLLVTEIAPVDLILQRAGRLHRHPRPRPPALEQPALWLPAPNCHAGRPSFGAGTEAVYDYHILLRTWLALKDRQSLAIPGEISPLIESVYREEPPPIALSAELQQAWQESASELQRAQEEEQAQARQRYILPPFYEDDLLEDDNPELAEDDPGVHRSLQAVTRLGPPTVAVVFLYEHAGQLYLDPQGASPVSLTEEPDRATTVALLRRSVSLSHRGLTPWLMQHGELPPGWRRHPLLCRHRLLRLDADNRWQGQNVIIRLDPELGVVITSAAKEAI